MAIEGENVILLLNSMLSGRAEEYNSPPETAHIFAIIPKVQVSATKN